MKRLTHDLKADVSLWWIDLDSGPTPDMADCLDSAERNRARRLTESRQAKRFLASHMALRMLLADFLHRAPCDVRLGVDALGKPREQTSGVCFNLSRSDHQCVIGVSTSVEVGVDIEVIRSVPEMAGLARMHFDADELRSWSTTSPAFRDRAFLHAWTRKEACVKAVGAGLRVPLAAVHTGTTAGPLETDVLFAGRRHRALVDSRELSSGAIAAVAVIQATGAVAPSARQEA